MAYQLNLEEPLRDSIRRIAHEQIDHALQQLRDQDADRDEAVHEARKSFKMLRAVLRLLQKPIGDAYDDDNAFFRDLGRTLAPLRDTFVVIETLDKSLDGVKDRKVKRDAKKIRAKLNENYEAAREQILGDEAVINGVIAQLESAHERVERWNLDSDSFELIQRGVEKPYKRGLGAMHAAYEDVLEPEGFHEWRKYVKYSWYHMRILTPIWEDVLAPYADELHQLSKLLGKAHDIAVLQEQIRAFEETERGGGRKLLALLDQQRAELEEAARVPGQRIYAETPDEFIRRLAEYWDAQPLADPLHAS